MKFPTMKKKTRLVLWTIFCLLGLGLNAWNIVDHLDTENNWRIFRSAVWCVLFTISGVSSYLKYRKEVQAERERELAE